MIVDLVFEAPCKCGPRQVMGFSQPEFEGALEQAVLDLGITIRRSIGESRCWRSQARND
jgi:hypothetical protein